LRDDGWLNVRGAGFTSGARITEKFRRPKYGRIEIDVTIDDPRAYTKPWTVRVNWRLREDEDLIEFICQENNREFVALRERHHKTVRDQGPTLTSGLRYRASMSTRAVAVIRLVPLSSQAQRSFRSCAAASVVRLPGAEIETKPLCFLRVYA
jgi:hypothetical protein